MENQKQISKTKEENTLIGKKKLLIPKVDVVFQSLFNKDNLEITKSFAEAILEEKIESIAINEDKNLLRENIGDKLGILDLELDINNKEKVDVEIQLLYKEDFKKRIMWYLTRLYSKQAKIGEDYNKINRVVVIAIVDFEIEETKGIEEMETVWKMIETKKRQKILTEDLEIHIIDIRKAREMYKKDKSNRKAQWIMFLDDPNSREVKEIMGENKGVKEAVIKVMELSEDEKMERLEFLRLKAIMDEKSSRRTGYHEGLKKGIEDGLEQGIQQGIQQGIKEGQIKTKEKIIKNLYKAGMRIEDIAKNVEINIDEINKILNLSNK